MVAEVVIYLLVGLVGGAVGGLLGTGSSMIILPALSFILPHTLANDALGMHMAIGTCMAAISVTACSVAYQYMKAGFNDWYWVKRLLPAYIVGPLLGATVSSLMPSHWLKIYVAAFIILAGIKMLWGYSSKPSDAPSPSPLLMLLLTFVVATVSSIAGVAIGLLMVPMLHHFGFRVKAAVQVSLISAVLYTLFGALGFVATGWDKPELPPWSLGYVYLPAFALISLGVIVTSSVVARFAVKLPTEWLKKIFAVFLLVAGLNLVVFTFI